MDFKAKKGIFCLCLSIILFQVSQADVYVRNRFLTEALSRQGRTYLPLVAAKRYFSKDELKRCQFDRKSLLLIVDGQKVAPLLKEEQFLVPVELMAEALGFTKKENKALGVTDFLPPKATEKMSDRKSAQAVTKRRGGAGYRRAEAGMLRALLKYRKLEQHQELSRVERIGQEIVAVSDMPTLNWHFFVVSDPDPNAFCTGEGWVAVTDGLLNLKLTDDELAGVLAHEVAHGCRKDLEERRYNKGVAKALDSNIKKQQQVIAEMERDREQLAQAAVQYYELAATAQTDLVAEEYRRKAGRAASKAKGLENDLKKLREDLAQKQKDKGVREELAYSSKYRRKDEIDADVKGLYYATRAGYSSEGLLDALKKVADSGAAKFGQAAYQGGYNHPPLSQRLVTLRKVQRDWRNQR